VKRVTLTALMQPRKANGRVSSVTGSLPHLAGILLMLSAIVHCSAMQCFPKRSGRSCRPAQRCMLSIADYCQHLCVPEGFAINADVQDAVMPLLAMHICPDVIAHQAKMHLHDHTPADPGHRVGSSRSTTCILLHREFV